jgi:hypothetical protein
MAARASIYSKILNRKSKLNPRFTSPPTEVIYIAKKKTVINMIISIK